MSDNAPVTPPIFDGHNDILSLLYDASLSMDAPIDIDRFITGMAGHLDVVAVFSGTGWLSSLVRSGCPLWWIGVGIGWWVSCIFGHLILSVPACP